MYQLNFQSDVSHTTLKLSYLKIIIFMYFYKYLNLKKWEFSLEIFARQTYQINFIFISPLVWPPVMWMDTNTNAQIHIKTNLFSCENHISGFGWHKTSINLDHEVKPSVKDHVIYWNLFYVITVWEKRCRRPKS